MSLAVDFDHLKTAQDPAGSWARFLEGNQFHGITFVLDGDAGIRRGASFVKIKERNQKWEDFLHNLKIV